MNTGRIFALLSLLALTGCVSYGGGGLKIGEADADAVQRSMGQPAAQWQAADGSRQLAFPRGPQGVHTFMVFLGPDGKLQRIENSLEPGHFARVQPGMGEQAVLRLLGPVTIAQGDTYYARRNERVWEWRYCDEWNVLARFYVLFDGTARTVRSTMSLPDEDCGRFDGGPCWCGR
jgi:hypothetical protein